MFEIELFTTIFSEISPEVLFAIGGFGFNLLVIPTLLDSNAGIPRTQSVMSAVVLLFFFAIPYYWIGFHWSAFANLIGVVLWSVVAIYRAPTTATSPKDSPATTAQPAD